VDAVKLLDGTVHGASSDDLESQSRRRESYPVIGKDRHRVSVIPIIGRRNLKSKGTYWAVSLLATPPIFQRLGEKVV